MNHRIFLLTLLVLGLTANSVAQEPAGEFPGALLRTPLGARAAGMGEAFVSVADDATAVFYNPGGLHQLKGVSFSGSYSSMPAGGNPFYGGLTVSGKQFGTLGVMYKAVDIAGLDGGTVPFTTHDQDDETVLSVSYGQRILYFFGVGGSVKYVNNPTLDFSPSRLGYDIGAHFRLGHEKFPISLGAGAVLRDVATRVVVNSGEGENPGIEDVPSTINVGAHAKLDIQVLSVLVAASHQQTGHGVYQDYELNEDITEYNLGTELWFGEGLALRAGQAGEDYHFGASLQLPALRLDYAHIPDRVSENGLHKFGVIFNF